MKKILTILLIVSFAVVVSAQGEEQAATEGESRYPIKDHVLILTDQTLQEAIDEYPLILVKFFAPWCGHCKSLAPTYSDVGRALQLSEDGPDAPKVASIDCTENKEACSKNGIRGYPTLLYFIDGQPHKFTGQRTQEGIIEFLNNKPSEVRSEKEAENL